MLQTLAHVEAHIDFPDEDISPDTKDQLLGRLDRGVAFMDDLLRTANEGQILRRGIRAAIVGRPNAGKSSLLNQLLGHERAIVSPVPGTTRDTIEETANIRGLPVVFIDTAGLREARDELEQEGVRRSRESLARAEFILQVLDASAPLTPADERHLAEFAGKQRILVVNKMDLPRKWSAEELASQVGVQASACSPDKLKLELQQDSRVTERRAPPRLESADAVQRAGPVPGAPIVEVSCLSGQGIEALKDAIKALVWSGEITAGMLPAMINSRHQDALTRARAATQRTLEVLRGGETLELAAGELRIAVNAVGEIVGRTTTEDLLDSIFSQFCIGK